MAFWLKAMNDGTGTLYSGQVDYINNYDSASKNNGAVWPTTPQDMGSVVAEGTGAAMRVSNAQYQIMSLLTAGKSSMDNMNNMIDQTIKLISG